MGGGHKRRINFWLSAIPFKIVGVGNIMGGGGGGKDRRLIENLTAPTSHQYNIICIINY